MKIFAKICIITALSINQLLMSMEKQETELTVVGPIARQSSGTSTVISIADSPSPTRSLTSSTSEHITMRLPRHLRSSCPDTIQQCKYLIIAGVIALIVFTLVPLPNHT